MQKLKSKLLPSSSFSGLSSVVWKRKETSERDWVLKRWLVGIISESRAELAPRWVDFGRDGSEIVREIDVLSCKMSNRCFALCFFFCLKFHESRHRIHSPICVTVVVNQEGCNLFLVYLFKKVICPWLLMAMGWVPMGGVSYSGSSVCAFSYILKIRKVLFFNWPLALKREYCVKSGHWGK